MAVGAAVRLALVGTGQVRLAAQAGTGLTYRRLSVARRPIKVLAVVVLVL